MTLLDDWKWVLKKAWSVRLITLAGLFSGLEAALPLFTDSMPKGLFALLAVFVSIAAIIFRVVAQKGNANGG